MRTRIAKEPIKIRTKKLKGGNQSIYLDIYRNGQRQYKFLNLYIVVEKDETDKEKNKQTLELANKIKSKMILESDNLEHGFSEYGEKQKSNVIKYLKELSKKKKEENKMSDYYSLNGMTNYLEKYKGKNVTFKNLTKEYIKGFIDYLKTTTLSAGSQSAYITMLKGAISKAEKDDYINKNPIKKLDKKEIPRQPESNREYLTIEEIKKLVNTECIKEVVKQAFLFICFSGFRYSDVIKLKWGDIQNDNENKKVIKFIQKKTNKIEHLQISDEALKYLPEQIGNDDERIFNLSQNGYMNQTLSGWALSAGIKKHVTFHVGRHTNATLLLSLGVSIETVSKILGHKEIKTTQIYAKIIDKNKRDAVSKLDLAMKEEKQS